MVMQGCARGASRRLSGVVVFLLASGVAAWPAAGQTGPQTDAAGQSQAQADVDALSLQDILGAEVQSVFGASKFLQKITDAPAAVTLVTADEIQRYGWLTLADVLSSVRGFYVTDDRAYAYVGTRGFLRPGDYTTRLLLLVDGLRINDNVFDQALIQEDFQVDLRDVDRIEIIRGPSSSLYGSSAFFGVVNVVTKRPSTMRGAQVTFDSGTLGRRGGRVALSREFASGLGVAVSATGQRIDGVGTLHYPEFDGAAGPGAALIRGRDGADRQNVFARTRYGGLSINASFNNRTRALPTGAYGTVLGDARATIADERVSTDAAWEGTLGKGWHTRLRGAYDVYRYEGRLPYFLDDTEPDAGTYEYVDVANGRWVTGEVQASRSFGPRHRFTGGVERRQHLRQDQSSYIVETGAAELDVPHQSATTALYAQDEFRLHRAVRINAGVRYDRYAQFSSPIKPRVAAILQPRDKTTVKLIYGSAFRAPNVFEAYYLIPGQWKSRPALTPEDIHTYEAVVEHYQGSRLRLAGGYFWYHVHDLINFQTDPDDGLVLFANQGNAGASGYELEAEAKWPTGAQFRASYTFSVARTDAGETLSNAPRHVVQTLAAVRVIGETFLGFDAAWLSERLSRSGARVPSYLRPNLTLSGPLLGDRLRFAFTVSNATNTVFADPVGDDFRQDTVTQNGRTARLQLTWQF